MSVSGSFLNSKNHTNMESQPASTSKMKNNMHPQSNNHRKDNGVNAEASSGQPVKASRTHNVLHKELLLAHKRGLALSNRSELQQVLERRKRVQNDWEKEGQNRTPLEDVLLRRQQQQLEREKEEQKEKVQEEAQLMEFFRVRQNLRKIPLANQTKAGNFLGVTEECPQNVE